MLALTHRPPRGIDEPVDIFFKSNKLAKVLNEYARMKKEIDRRLKGKQPQGPFRYFDKGDMATIARFKAIARVRNLRLTGLVAWLAWLAVHLFYLTSFKNRVTALLHWFVTFASNDRSERTATEQQIFARLALERVGPEEFVSSPHAQHPDRDELEQIAAEEARLTDEGVRGRAATSPAG